MNRLPSKRRVSLPVLAEELEIRRLLSAAYIDEDILQVEGT